MTIHWKAVEQYFNCGAGCVSILSSLKILENLSILELALPRVRRRRIIFHANFGQLRNKHNFLMGNGA